MRDREVGGGDPLPQGHRSRRRWAWAQSSAEGSTAPQRGGREAVGMPAPPDVPPWPRPAGGCHHGLPPSPRLTPGWPDAFRAQGRPNCEGLEKAEGLRGAGRGGTTRAARRGVSEAPVPTAIRIKGHSHSTFFSSIAK